jgi:hypothetical protein
VERGRPHFGREEATLWRSGGPTGREGPSAQDRGRSVQKERPLIRGRGGRFVK